MHTIMHSDEMNKIEEFEVATKCVKISAVCHFL